MDHGYSAPRACALTGATYRQVDYWCRTRRITPSVSDTTGSGCRRRFSFDDLVRLRVVVDLLAMGLVLDAAFVIADRAADAEPGVVLFDADGQVTAEGCAPVGFFIDLALMGADIAADLTQRAAA